MRIHRPLAAAALTLALAGCAGLEVTSCPAASCAAPRVTVSSALATPGTTLRLDGTYFMDGCNDVLPTTASVDPFGALAIAVVVGDRTMDVGTVTPDADGSWTLRWTVPDGVEGPVGVTARAGDRELSVDVVEPDRSTDATSASSPEPVAP